MEPTQPVAPFSLEDKSPIPTELVLKQAWREFKRSDAFDAINWLFHFIIYTAVMVIGATGFFGGIVLLICFPLPTLAITGACGLVYLSWHIRKHLKRIRSELEDQHRYLS